MSVSLMRDAAGAPVGFYWVSRDRTELIQTEQALRESEESYRSVLALALDAIVIARAKNGSYVQVNDAFCRITGRSPGEAIGRSSLDLNLYLDPVERKRLLEALRRDGRVGGFEIRVQAKDGTIIHKRLQDDLWPVDVDQGRIEQVFLNLYVNAWHAMPEGGKLYIETKNVILDQDKISSYGLKPGRFVRVSVTDTGVGMDEGTLKRAFDPFFTTKEMGRGTGLGLASAYGIIRNHNGIIDVYSEKGEGATFNIYLPASDKQIDEKAVPFEAILQGSETILFVDDEETILQVGKQLLERLGYRVIEALNGPTAIEIFEKTRESVHIVILDMIMPGMSGGEAYDRLREIDPNVKVLLSSGYSINGQARKILDRGCRGFIQKPYNLRELSRKIRQILDR